MKGTPEEKAAWQREYRKNNQEYVNAQDCKHSLRKKGIHLSVETIMEMKKQTLCDICGKPETGKKGLAVDHCHTTNKVRGMLCQNCNHALGKFKDDVTILERAIAYLKQNNPKTEG